MKKKKSKFWLWVIIFIILFGLSILLMKYLGIFTAFLFF